MYKVMNTPNFLLLYNTKHMQTAYIKFSLFACQHHFCIHAYPNNQLCSSTIQIANAISFKSAWFMYNIYLRY